MLWPTGHIYPAGGGQDGGTWDALALYIKKGAEACRVVCPQAKVVIHVEMSKSGQNVLPFLRSLAAYNPDYDIIGLSYYPHYHGNLNTLNSLLTNIEKLYPTKKIQLVETGYYHAYYPDKADYNYTSTYPATEEGQRKFTADLIETLNKHQQVDGLYWWWPETCEYGINWQNAVTPSGWYNAGLWDNETGRALTALYELKAFRTDETVISSPLTTHPSPLTTVYDLSGRKAVTGQRPAIHVRNGKKVITGQSN